MPFITCSLASGGWAMKIVKILTWYLTLLMARRWKMEQGRL